MFQKIRQKALNIGRAGSIIAGTFTADAALSQAYTSRFTREPLPWVQQEHFVEHEGRILKIPDEVLRIAKDRKIDPKLIEIQGDSWVACIKETCIVLEPVKAPGEKLKKDFAGILEKRPPNYLMVTREGFEKILLPLINSRTDTTFIILATVPDLCEPCQRFDPVLKNFAKDNSADKNLKIIAVKFDDFSTAKAFVGQSNPDRPKSAQFPHTIIAGPVAESRKEKVKKLTKVKLDEFPGSLKQFLNQHRVITSLSGFISDGRLKEKVAENRAFAESLSVGRR